VKENPGRHNSGWIKVPIGEGAREWTTVLTNRKVLAVTRSVNAAVRLLDVLGEMLRDQRVQVLFTMPRERSAFDDGAAALLQEEGVRFIPWDQAVTTRFDLIVSASYKGEFSLLDGPLMVLPHGAGFGKQKGLPPAGSVPRSGTHAKGTTMVLASRNDRALFAGDQPAGTRFLVAGDPCYDRLRASLPFVEQYRHALGIPRTHKLLVLSSTWGEKSLLGCRPELPARLLGCLPVDEFRVALALHPNVWFGHSRWQIRTWLGQALDAGLILLEPQEAWRAGLVAADVIVGDHGSVTLYGAALGKPTLIGATGEGEVLEQTPMGELVAEAHRLTLTAPLQEQLEDAIEAHRLDRAEELSTLTFEAQGEALAKLRREAYRLMELEEPQSAPRVLAVPIPDQAPVECRAQRVFGNVSSTSDASGLTLWRLPAAHEDATDPPPPPNFSHLVVEETEPDIGLRQSAAIITRSPEENLPPDRAADWAEQTLSEYPGCRIAAILGPGAQSTVFPRERSPQLVEVVEDEGSRLDPALLASATLVRLLAGVLDDEPGPVELTVADRRYAMSARDLAASV
jgi:hypothetical protein